MTQAVVTTGKLHDSQVFEELLTGNEVEVYADSAYASEKTAKQLESKGIENKILKRAYRNKPLTKEDKAFNRVCSDVMDSSPLTQHCGKIYTLLIILGGCMKKYKRIGIDLAKNIIQVCAVDHNEKRVFNKALRRAEVMKFFSECEPCLIGIEACSSAHYWACTLNKLGHTVKLIAPQKVKPYVTGHKNDMRDAESICEAVSRPHMTFVEIKCEEQQARLALHKIRQ